MAKSVRGKASSSRKDAEGRKFRGRKRSINQQLSSTRHIPQRTCVACRKVMAKRELVRLVRAADGRVEVDNTGKKAGRGVYLCRTRECWQLGLKGKRVGHALRSTIARDNREQLIRYGECFGEGNQ